MLPWAATRLAVLGDQGLLSVHKGSYPRWEGATHPPTTPTPALPHRRTFADEQRSRFRQE